MYMGSRRRETVGKEGQLRVLEPWGPGRDRVRAPGSVGDLDPWRRGLWRVYVTWGTHGRLPRTSLHPPQ